VKKTTTLALVFIFLSAGGFTAGFISGKSSLDSDDANARTGEDWPIGYDPYGEMTNFGFFIQEVQGDISALPDGVTDYSRKDAVFSVSRNGTDDGWWKIETHYGIKNGLPPLVLISRKGEVKFISK